STPASEPPGTPDRREQAPPPRSEHGHGPPLRGDEARFPALPHSPAHRISGFSRPATPPLRPIFPVKNWLGRRPLGHDTHTWTATGWSARTRKVSAASSGSTTSS